MKIKEKEVVAMLAMAGVMAVFRVIWSILGIILDLAQMNMPSSDPLSFLTIAIYAAGLVSGVVIWKLCKWVLDVMEV